MFGGERPFLRPTGAGRDFDGRNDKSRGREIRRLCILKAKGSILGFLAVAAVLCAGAASAGAAGHGLAPVPPLGSSLVRPTADLGGGKVGRYSWKISAFGREGRLPLAPHDRQRPCLEAYVTEKDGLDDLAGCYGPGHLTATSEPLMLIREEPVGSGSPTMTLVGMAFAPAAAQLEVSFADGSHETIDLRRLNPAPARRIARERFGYTAFAVKGSWCPDRLVSLNAAGESLWEVQERSCPSHAGADGWVEGVS
jgi:hypothetical protein